MEADSPKDQIPKDWLALIGKDEVENEIDVVTKEIMVSAGLRLKLHQPSQEEVTIACAKAWDMSITEVQDALQKIIDIRTKTRLFVRYYGHLFPKDEKGFPVLRPAEIAVIHGMSEQEVIDAIYENKEDLLAKGLLHEWPDEGGGWLC